jgi:hypothetical protein
MDLNSINSRNVEPLPGVYKIYLPNYPCPRLLGTDLSGLLYIGKSKDLRQRLNNLRLACDLNQDIAPEKRGEKHIFAKGLFQLIEGIPNFLNNHPRLNPANFYIEVHYENQTGFTSEEELIRSYMLTYGEVPPFNFKR